MQTGIQTYGVVFTPNYGYVYAYEVDGLNHANLMDDANIPSLLSAPYIGYTKATSLIYPNTRKFLLSKDNPTYYTGKLAHGIGSPHTNDGWVWPLAILMQGFTATTDERTRRTCSTNSSTPTPATTSCTSRSIRTIRRNIRASISAGRTRCSAST